MHTRMKQVKQDTNFLQIWMIDQILCRDDFNLTFDIPISSNIQCITLRDIRVSQVMKTTQTARIQPRSWARCWTGCRRRRRQPG